MPKEAADISRVDLFFKLFDKTKKVRDAIGEFILKFLATGWPAFLSAFLLATMVNSDNIPAITAEPTGNLVFFIVTMCVAVLGVVANIVLLPFNNHKEKVSDLLSNDHEEDDKKYVLSASAIKDTVQALKDRMAKLMDITIGDGDEEEITAENSTLSMLERQGVGAQNIAPAIYVKMQAIKAKIVAIKGNVETFNDKAIAANATETSFDKSRGLRYLMFGFQTLATAVGSAGLPFFILLTINALFIQVTSVAVVWTVVGLAAAWGVIAGIQFVRDLYNDHKEHEGNVDALETNKNDLQNNVKELDASYGRIKDYFDHKQPNFNSDGMHDAEKDEEFEKVEDFAKDPSSEEKAFFDQRHENDNNRKLEEKQPLLEASEEESSALEL